MKNKSSLEKWLASPSADAYFGRAFVLKFAVLTQIIRGKGNLAQLARQHGVCKQAVYKHAHKAREVFGL